MNPPRQYSTAETAVQIGQHGVQLENHAAVLIEHGKDIKTLYKALSYRLPLWATFLISGLTFANGWLVAIRL